MAGSLDLSVNPVMAFEESVAQTAHRMIQSVVQDLANTYRLGW